MSKLKYFLCYCLKALYDNPITLYMLVLVCCLSFESLRASREALLSDNHQYVEIVNQFIQVPFGAYVVVGAILGWVFINSVLAFSFLYQLLDFLCSTQKFKNVLEKSH